jgi:hypothetical protein
MIRLIAGKNKAGVLMVISIAQITNKKAFLAFGQKGCKKYVAVLFEG